MVRWVRVRVRANPRASLWTDSFLIIFGWIEFLFMCAYIRCWKGEFILIEIPMKMRLVSVKDPNK